MYRVAQRILVAGSEYRKSDTSRVCGQGSANMIYILRIYGTPCITDNAYAHVLGKTD
jgi:hypothetical protein